MIIDFRMRPPARGFLNIGVYDDVARTAKLTECFSMKQAPSVAQKSPELMLQEMDTAGVTMGVIPGRIRKSMIILKLLEAVYVK